MRIKIALLCAIWAAAFSTAYATEPSIGTHTKKIVLNANDFYSSTPAISDVTEGLFSIQGKNGWSVYNVESGQLIFKDVTRQAAPKFSGGAAVVKQGKANVIIYPNGTKKQLPTNWTVVSEMADGVAVAQGTTPDFIPFAYCINDKGEKIWPNLTRTGKKLGRLPDLRIRGSHDGLRAYYNGDKWGFINEQGEIVVKPKYNNVEDFSEGYAVVNLGATYGLIDTKGLETIPATTFKVKPGNVSCGYLKLQDGNDLTYYTPQGIEAQRYKGGFLAASGSDFYEGLAYVNLTKDFNQLDKTEDNAIIVNTDFKVVSTIDNNKGTYNIVEGGPFFHNGLALVNSARTFISPGGNPAIQKEPEDDASFRPFSDNYAFAEVKINGTVYRGLVGLNGEFAVIVAL